MHWLWCMIVICGNNPEKGIKYRHTWNIVKLGGKYYHMDVTFDNSLSHNGIRYDYFNLDDKNIFRDHEPLIAPAPHCTDGDHFYYREKKLSFTKQEEVYKRALQTCKKKVECLLSLAWRISHPGNPRRTSGTDPESRKRKQKSARISLNMATLDPCASIMWKIRDSRKRK